MLAKIAIALAAGLGFGTVAADAGAATLTVTVSPASLHPGTHYTVTITGRYNRRPRRSPPYLLAFIQYSGSSCKSTATAEYALPTSEWDWVFYPERAETSSPFKALAYWKAGPRLGTRRICAYLYRDSVAPTSKAAPLVRASTSFSNTRSPKR